MVVAAGTSTPSSRRVAPAAPQIYDLNNRTRFTVKASDFWARASAPSRASASTRRSLLAVGATSDHLSVSWARLVQAED